MKTVTTLSSNLTDSHTCMFTHVLHQLPACGLSYDWSTGLAMSFVIGRGDNFLVS